MQPWLTIERVETPEGPLELRRRGAQDFLITIAGRVLMTSAAHRSEDALAHLTCAALGQLPHPPQLLLGGLGMAYTLRAILDRSPAAAQVRVVDLNPQVVAWCHGALAPLTGRAADDPRVSILVDDVARVIAAAPAAHYDAIVLDLYEGPRPSKRAPSFAGRDDHLYGTAALKRAFNAVRPGGVVAIWSEEPDRSFEARFATAGFHVERHRSGGRGGRSHVIYLGHVPEGLSRA